jgi:hypothetical protein
MANFDIVKRVNSQNQSMLFRRESKITENTDKLILSSTKFKIPKPRPSSSFRQRPGSAYRGNK